MALGEPEIPPEYRRPDEDNNDDSRDPVLPDEPEWDNNPYEGEIDDSGVESADSFGEGERFELDEEPISKRHCSRTQAARFHMQIRAPVRNAGDARRNQWQDPHWLWWSRRLAEYYCCLLINHIERDKFAHMKKKQENLVSALPERLLASFRSRIQRALGVFTYIKGNVKNYLFKIHKANHWAIVPGLEELTLLQPLAAEAGPITSGNLPMPMQSRVALATLTCSSPSQ